jgi:hypothetical protein
MPQLVEDEPMRNQAAKKTSRETELISAQSEAEHKQTYQTSKSKRFTSLTIGFERRQKPKQVTFDGPLHARCMSIMALGVSAVRW